MISDQEFKNIFNANKFDVPDDGFSGRVMRRLPERPNILPQAVMVVCVFVGLALTVAVQGVGTMIDQIAGLISAISQMQMPTPGSVIAYICSLALLSFIGFAVARADAE